MSALLRKNAADEYDRNRWKRATHVSLEEVVFASDRAARRRLFLRVIVLLVLCAA
jgi:hypothetical protein